MKKVFYSFIMLCIIVNLMGCSMDYDLEVDDHAWTFYTITEDYPTPSFCNPALADQFPDAEPIQLMLIPINNMVFELIGSNELLGGNVILTFNHENVPGNTNQKEARYSVVWELESEDAQIISGVVKTQNILNETVYTLELSSNDGFTLTFTSPLDD